MAVEFKEPVSCESLDERTKNKECPTIRAMDGNISKQQLEKFVLEFSAFFYGYNREQIDLKLRFIEDLEVYLYTGGKGGDPKYGRIFVDPKRINETGLSDQGLSYYLYINGILDAMGIDIKGIYRENSIEDNVPNSKTIGDIISNIEILLAEHGKMKE